MGKNELQELIDKYTYFTAPIAIFNLDGKRLWDNSEYTGTNSREKIDIFFDLLCSSSLKRLSQKESIFIQTSCFPNIVEGAVSFYNGNFCVAVFGVGGDTSSLAPRSLMASEGFESNIRGELSEASILLSALEHRMDSDVPETGDMIMCLRRRGYKILRNTQNAALISRFYSGSLQIHRVACDMNALISSLCLTVSSIIVSNIKLIVNLPPERIVASIDVRLAERAILNLLLNSYKYTRDNNAITVSLTENEKYVTLFIRDFGAGIRRHNLIRVREPYFSCEPADDSNFRPGMGAGLSIAAICAELHKGTMAITSEFGEGTTVALSLSKNSTEDADIFCASTTTYIADRFSPAYVELCEFCEIPK
ncbi:MAG: ATP-binding protein [Oscillospiraceae bacterium]